MASFMNSLAVCKRKYFETLENPFKSYFLAAGDLKMILCSFLFSDSLKSDDADRLYDFHMGDRDREREMERLVSTMALTHHPYAIHTCQVSGAQIRFIPKE